MMHSSVGDLIRQGARHFGDKAAVIFEGRSWTFRELDQASSRLAWHLQRLGILAGEKVALYSANCPEWVIAYYAVMKIGGVVTPLNSMLTPPEAVYVVNDCRAAAIIGSDDCIAGVCSSRSRTGLRECIAYGGQPPEGARDFSALLDAPLGDYPVAGIQSSDDCTVCYTSGTTGQPKGAVLSHRSILLNTESTAAMHGRCAADTMVNALPCPHVYGKVMLNAAIACGVTLVMHRTFNAERILQSIQDHRATIFDGVPTMYMYLLNCPRLREFDLSSLTRCSVGGQALSEANTRRVEQAFGCRLLEAWGMTELGGTGTTHRFDGPRKMGSVGVAMPGMDIRILATDGSGRGIPDGGIGELQIRGPVMMRGYFGQAEATAQAIDADGWLHTGDLARRDQDGYLYLVDRLKDIIITGGFKIYPNELERVISEHAGVAMVAVGSIADEIKGELAKAYLVARPGSMLDLSDVDRHCRERLAAYKVPKAYQIVADLPKGGTGKVVRRRLHELDTQ